MGQYFFDATGDARMEEQNIPHWKALIAIIEGEAKRGDSLPARNWDILDVGCHTGGLLMHIQGRFGLRANSVAGVEPLAEARAKALGNIPSRPFYADVKEVPSNSMDIVVSHEALYLVADLRHWVGELKRVLRPEGGAFIAFGSHAENTAWMRWRLRLDDLYSHKSYVYNPVDILQAGHEAGFHMELRQLHPTPTTSRRYSPPEDGWGEFKSAREMLEHQDQKYVFVFYPKQ